MDRDDAINRLANSVVIFLLRRISLLEQLDVSQRNFCRAPSTNNIRLLAPAGCGKTLCLLYICKYLADKASNLVRPRRLRFLIVTFTKAAQQELTTRLNEDFEFSSIRDFVEITTLNSWGFRRIKNVSSYPKLITSKDDYHFAMLNQLQPIWQKHTSIRDAINKNSWTQRNSPRKLMDSIDAFKSLGFDHVRHTNYQKFAKHWDELVRQGLGWRLEEQCNELTKLDVLDSQIIEDRQEVPIGNKRKVYNAFFRFWRDSTAHLIESATFTLEDQKYYAYLDEYKNVEEGRRLSGAASYNHIFVDEFQDINPLDLALVKAIVERNRATLTIAGDDDQAIFEWRGATPEYILNPEEFFGTEFKTYTLGVNYRSPANVVIHSQMLIEHNGRRVPKQIKASSRDSALIDIIETSGFEESLDYVHNLVKETTAAGGSPSRVAIIGRKRSQIIPYQVYFASKKVPFCAAEDLQVFLSKTFDRLLNLLEIKARSLGRQSSGQIVNDIVDLCDLVKRYPLNRKNKQGVLRHLHQAFPRDIRSAIEALEQYDGELKGKNHGRQMSIEMADAISDFVSSHTVADTLHTLSDCFEGLHYDMGKAEEDIFYTDPPFLQLAKYAERYGEDYDSFVHAVMLAKRTLLYVPPFEDDGNQDNLWKDPLHLMTALRAKGKEFDTVVLLDVVDGIWPNRNAKTPEQMEAERRVFYVAFTRAKARIVMLVDKHLGQGSASSPYIDELGIVRDG